MENLLKQINRKKIPKHIAIIMDGNGRWALKRNLPRIEGHREGIKSIKDIIKACLKLGVKILTLYTFSTENWKRPRREIHFLFTLLHKFLKKYISKIKKEKIKLLISGDISKLPTYLQTNIKKAIEETKNNKRFILNIALNYGSRQEIINAVNKIISSNEKNINIKKFEKYLYTANLKDPDLLIRTSGEKRISNFLLWQLAYTELYFTETLWPDFRSYDLYKAILDYQNRERRFGGI